MGSPIGITVANLYMEDFEIKAIDSALYPPRIWKNKFLEHISKMGPHIQFTTEDAKPDGSLPSWTQ